MVWIQTRTGRAFDLMHPTPDMIDIIGDVAPALALINRFTGHAGYPGPALSGHSVAQHSILGSDALLAETGRSELALAFLLHDAHEFAIGDISSPVAATFEALLGPEFKNVLTLLKWTIDQAIHAHLGLPFPWPEGVRAAVKEMDLRMLHAERAWLMTKSPKPWSTDGWAVAPVRSLTWREFLPMTPKTAAREWLNRLAALMPTTIPGGGNG